MELSADILCNVGFRTPCCRSAGVYSVGCAADMGIGQTIAFNALPARGSASLSDESCVAARSTAGRGNGRWGALAAALGGRNMG